MSQVRELERMVRGNGIPLPEWFTLSELTESLALYGNPLMIMLSQLMGKVKSKGDMQRFENVKDIGQFLQKYKEVYPKQSKKVATYEEYIEVTKQATGKDLSKIKLTCLDGLREKRSKAMSLYNAISHTLTQKRPDRLSIRTTFAELERFTSQSPVVLPLDQYLSENKPKRLDIRDMFRRLDGLGIAMDQNQSLSYFTDNEGSCQVSIEDFKDFHEMLASEDQQVSIQDCLGKYINKIYNDLQEAQGKIPVDQSMVDCLTLRYERVYSWSISVCEELLPDVRTRRSSAEVSKEVAHLLKEHIDLNNKRVQVKEVVDAFLGEYSSLREKPIKDLRRDSIIQGNILSQDFTYEALPKIVQDLVTSQEVRSLGQRYSTDFTAHSLSFHEYVVKQKALQKMPDIIDLDLDYEDLLKVAKGKLVPSTTEVFDDVGEVHELYEAQYVFLEEELQEGPIFSHCEQYAKDTGIPIILKDHEEVERIDLHEGQVLQIIQHGMRRKLPTDFYTGEVHDASNGQGEILLASCLVSEKKASDAVHEIMRKHPEQQTCPAILFFKGTTVIVGHKIDGVEGTFTFSQERQSLHSTKNQRPKLNGCQLSPNACVLYHGPHPDVFKNPKVLEFFSKSFPDLNTFMSIGRVQRPLCHRNQLNGDTSVLVPEEESHFSTSTVSRRPKPSSQEHQTPWAAVPKANRPTRVKVDDMPRRRRPYTPWL